MDIWRSIVGMVTAELTAVEKERLLAALNARGIILYRLESTGELTATMRMRRQDFSAAKRLVERAGGKLERKQRLGLYWGAESLLKRPVLLGTIALLIGLTLFLPTRVLFVRVDGNETVPQRRILAEAENCGITFGASRREVRSERVKNQLLERLPQLQWAGVNTSGCVATISVRERPVEEEPARDQEISGIAADRDGYILSITVTAGTPLVQEGQTVKKDQLLVSGYTDCGLTIRAERAEGEILAQTSRTLEVVTPSYVLSREQSRTTHRSYGILFGKKRINLWKDSGICDTTCGRMYREYAVTLPGGFALPIKLWTEEQTEYETRKKTIPQQQAESALEQFACRYLVSQMVAGEILEARWDLYPEGDSYRVEGTFLCTEMLGKRQQERIGALHGEDS